MLNTFILFFLENKLVTSLLLLTVLLWGIITSPFGWNKGILPDDPIPMDAIPDIGENQQIVYCEWPGRSPQDIEDQISFPLTSALLGISGVKTIRSHSIFGSSNIYLIFEDGIEFYWARTRILEKLNSLPVGTLPEGVAPSLGPDATALGQVYWYTLEGRDKEGRPIGGWDPQELRTIQDFYVKYALTSANGVAEVASIGGFVKEYQVDLNPDAMQAYGVTIPQVIQAVKESNQDIGVRAIEFNRTEYLVRALGYIRSLEDLEKSVVFVRNNIPVRLKDVADIHFGPATRRGGLDKGGAEAVGGVVVARYSTNPMQVINHVKAKIAEIAPGLPAKTMADGSETKVTIVPFYDRSNLIRETLGTLEEALTLEMIISIIVVIVLVLSLRASIIISSILPIGILITFIMMRQWGVDANIVALSGIAIAIGVMVDVGIVITENIIRHKDLPENINKRGGELLRIIQKATFEVAPAVITALTTTIVSFLPVFALEAAEGKLFRPLAFTKTFAMLSALIIGLTFLPFLAYSVFSFRIRRQIFNQVLNAVLVLLGLSMLVYGNLLVAFGAVIIGINNILRIRKPVMPTKNSMNLNVGIVLLVVIYFLAKSWLPLGAQNSLLFNSMFVVVSIAAILGVFYLIVRYYPRLLGWALQNKRIFISLPIIALHITLLIWIGFGQLFGFMPEPVKQLGIWQAIDRTFPGLGNEFMPSLDEGSFLLMPTTMPHSGISENLEVIRLLDMRVNAIPEVEMVVGKWGRVNSALDPAPISMFENLINYKSEYILDDRGHRMRFKTDDSGAFVLRDGTSYYPEIEQFRDIDKNELVNDPDGVYFRQWRDHIKTPDDIWKEIVRQTKIPGLTSAPKLQPIQTRLVMLQTGMRAPMGIKIFGPDLQKIEIVGLELENHLKSVQGIEPRSVFADRVVGKPYLEIRIDRDAIARFGLSIKAVQSQLSSIIGGTPLTTTVEGRERYSVRLRYAREFRDNPDDIKKIRISTTDGISIPLGELVTVDYRKGAQIIKSENTFLTAYVIFDKKNGFAEVDVVENAQNYLLDRIADGSLVIPDNISYSFTGNYQNQVRATKRLMFVIPISLMIILLILFMQFRSWATTVFIFSGILIAFSGGFILLWLYGQSWFMDISIAGMSLRDMFQIDQINISVAVWVGFIALFGIATDDGVLISTYLKQLFSNDSRTSVKEIRAGVLEAGQKRIRPAMMTTATTIIALLPVISSTGKGSDIMVPMAIPILGGMGMAILTVFIVPVLFCWWEEKKLLRKIKYKGN